MRRMRLSTAAVAASLALAVGGLAACTTDGGSADGTIESVDIMIPADPGGGWDQTGRAMAKVLKSEKIVDKTTPTNVPGAGGTTGLAQLQTTKEPNTLMLTGYVMVGAVETNHAAVGLDSTTPIAKLTEEQEVVVVPKDSPYQSIDDLVADVKKRGKDVAIAGGSAGGVDNILAGMIYKAAGLDAADLNYVPYDGGGETVAALLGNKVDAGISGAGEYREQVAAGDLRALATSGTEAVEGYDGVKSLSDQGLDVVVTNWRGVVAPPNISDKEAEALEQAVADMHETDAWKKVLSDNDWTDAYMPGDEFGDYIGAETTTVQGILKEIGLI